MKTHAAVSLAPGADADPACRLGFLVGGDESVRAPGDDRDPRYQPGGGEQLSCQDLWCGDDMLAKATTPIATAVSGSTVLIMAMMGASKRPSCKAR